MNAGDAYQRQGSRQVWVVVSDPQLDSDLLVVNLTSNKTWQDQSCVLQVGDHPFITVETVVFYREAKVVGNADLDHLLIRTDQIARSGAAKRLGANPCGGENLGKNLVSTSGVPGGSRAHLIDDIRRPTIAE